MGGIAIIGDLHIGVRSASKLHHAYMHSVIKKIFSYLVKNNIHTVIQLGDLFDDRKSLHLWAWDFFDRCIQEQIEYHNIDWFQIVGNHDAHYRESLEINTPRLRLADHKNVSIIDKPTEIKLGRDLFLMIPWMTKNNFSECMEAVASTQAEYCCGHFEFDGFDHYRGSPAKTDFSHKEFSKFKRVYSGHYHTFSSRDNVIYTGTPYELTWQDCGDEKSFIVHHGKTYDKIPTEEKLYVKVSYEDGLPDPSYISGKIVRLVVNNRPDKLEFNKYLHAIEAMAPYDLKVQEVFVDELSEERATVDIMKTRDVISEYLDNSNLTLDKNRVMIIFDEIHSEAMHVVD